MKQNKYDDSGFFAKYSEMPRSVGGLEAAGEWNELRSMLPELRGKRVLDLGCGFGWHCRYVREQGAASVVGIDLSENMLSRAREMTDDAQIQYRRMAIEDADFAANEFDLVLSSLALHYVADFTAVCRSVRHCLKPGGSFVLSVEHPVFTALAAQDWCYNETREKLHWPLDRYHEEGPRTARFLDEDVVKYHRTLATYLNTLHGNGFQLAELSELKPTQQQLEQHPAWQEEVRRPMFLLLSAVKG
ncbi:class I SAM-dependent methyltransferase [Paenibacillus tepidiphilus]|uniref:class I SAM-dependent methyltransferase n=1 Tax=Paenibacillus tepidiphilus TaxID=2608683 RepID=UPI00123C7769|nr:class I SAM-dependent methyltransferase [Paenibacillus tepidiphilus]